MGKRLWIWGVPVVLWLAFCAWYTGLRGPLTADEIAAYAATMERNGGDSARIERLRRFMEEDTGRQFFMVNNLDMAQHPVLVSGAEPTDTADDLLARYMEYMYPALFIRACHPVFAGAAVADAMDVTGIAGAEHWTRAALMRYRSRRDMLDIALNPAFNGRHEFKLAALDKTIAYPVEAQLYLSDPRVLLLLALLVLTLVLDAVLCRRRDSATR